MKIRSFQFKRYRRRFKEALKTSHGPIAERTGWILRIEEAGGMAGFGEAADSLPGFGASVMDDIETDRGFLIQLEDSLCNVQFEPDRVAALNFIGVCPASIPPAIRFGFETAVCDLAARLNHIPLSAWITPGAPSAVPVNYLAASPIIDLDNVKAEIKSGGYPAVKIKVGTASISDDITAVKQMRSLFDQKIMIRIDANRAWDYNTAMNVLDVMTEYDIDYVEEPLKKFNPDRLIRLKEETGIRIALDESLSGIDDLGKVLSMKACDVLIIKPSVRGGIIASMGNFFLAAAHDCRTVLTSSLETEIGIAAQLHLAAALPGDRIPCGLDTLRLFETGNRALMKVTDGHIMLPTGNGIGEGIGEEMWDNL